MSKTTKKKSSSSKTPAQAITSEFKSWKKKNAGSDGDLTLETCNAEDGILELKFGANACTLTFPGGYPKETEGWYLFTEESDDKFQQWMEKVNEAVESGSFKLSAVLDKLVAAMGEVGLEQDVGGAEFGGDDPFGGHPEEKVKEKSLDKVDQEVASLEFAHPTSNAATLRLIQDLKALKRSQSKSGFSAEPVKLRGKANLYHWEVRLFDFEGPLAKDLQQFQKQSGKDYITIHLKFSADYPFKPPFVRVVEPVFQFRTGHVTLGGAICMELLTNTGWKPFNDIEQIIVQIRAEIGSPDGGARLDLNQSSSAYNESQAWEAYYRAANNHGWDTKGLGPQMFPTI
jgi:ubiquitin-conjugating enzyme E2 Q